MGGVKLPKDALDEVQKETGLKKNTTTKKSAEVNTNTQSERIIEMSAMQKLTVGLDLGDRSSRYCILDESGKVVSTGATPTTRAGMEEPFGKMAGSRIAMEAGTHSAWVSRLLGSLGHEAIVANAHEVKLITRSKKKNDRVDAEKLARLARVDPELLSPIRHRGAEAQADLAVIRARDQLVESRTALINCARGLVKPFGERLKKCDADGVGESTAEGLSTEAREAIEPLLKAVEEISLQIGEYDRRIGEIAKRYPEVKLLTEVYGVGQLVGLTFILTIDDPKRFTHSRDVGPYLGLTRRQKDSGDSEPDLRITKAGDGLTRKLLVQAAHCILRKGAPDSDLRVWGEEKIDNSAKGGKKRKKRAVVAVARKLAVLLHHLWVNGEVYDPLYQRKAEAAAKRKRERAGKVAA